VTVNTEAPLATIPAADINPLPVVVAASLPAVTVDVFTPTTDISISTVTIPLEFPAFSVVTPDAAVPAGTVLIQVELPEVTLGGDATAGPPPLWRINGYPCPSHIGAVTRR
jgi:hypothetical protein